MVHGLDPLRVVDWNHQQFLALLLGQVTMIVTHMFAQCITIAKRLITPLAGGVLLEMLLPHVLLQMRSKQRLASGVD